MATLESIDASKKWPDFSGYCSAVYNNKAVIEEIEHIYGKNNWKVITPKREMTCYEVRILAKRGLVELTIPQQGKLRFFHPQLVEIWTIVKCKLEE